MIRFRIGGSLSPATEEAHARTRSALEGRRDETSEVRPSVSVSVFLCCQSREGSPGVHSVSIQSRRRGSYLRSARPPISDILRCSPALNQQIIAFIAFIASIALHRAHRTAAGDFCSRSLCSFGSLSSSERKRDSPSAVSLDQWHVVFPLCVHCAPSFFSVNPRVLASNFKLQFSAQSLASNNPL